MDLEDLYSDMDDDELGALFSASGTLKLPSVSGSVGTKVSGGVKLGGRTYRVGSKLPSGYYWTKSGTIARKSSGGGIFAPLRMVSSTLNRARAAAAAAAKKKKSSTSSARKRALIAAMLKKGVKSPVRRVSSSSVMRLKRPVTRYSQFPLPKRAPISGTCPAAYRQLACNAGLGGSAGMTLLKQIRDMVQLSNTRQLATSEHNAINNTKAFRRAVLQKLGKRARCR